MANYDLVNQSYNEHVTQRLEYLKSVVDVVANNEAELYKEDSELDAFTAISTLNLVSDELDTILNAVGLMEKVLVELQKNEEQQNQVRQVVPA